jgi:uncharacterized membrane protein YphA (DoxX/SURF4 family)
MSETLAIVILLVVVVVPGAVVVLVLQGVGKKRGWNLMRTRHWMVAVSVGWPTALFLTVVRIIPASIVLLVAGAMLLVGYLYFAGIHGWCEYFRRRRGESGED